MQQILYTIGLLMALLYLIMGFDDFIWDLFSLTKRAKYKKSRLDFNKLRMSPPKLLAMTIGAWNESEVIGDVIDNLISSIQYPKSMYHLFVGVYPNDQDTVRIVKEIEDRVANVYMIVNCLNGPTTKAQNINYVIMQIKEFEKKNGWKFASITVHDAEDVVHPYELLVTNYMINYYDALQFPVFPLIQLPTFTNFFQTLTVGTYADEFAENHFNTMVGRCSTGAFVPSAGTGFALSRKTINSFETDEILPSNNLTEDYRLSLTLYEKGVVMYYVLDTIPRVSRDNKIVYDYITTRSMFPATFKTAVKQKARWILGITMQSVSMKEVFGKNKLSFIGRYSIYRDLKAKIGNLLAFIGYPIFIYFIISLFIPLIPIYPLFSFSWYLSLIVTIMMVERQISRSVSIYHVYGFRSVFFACLLPPIIPIRIVWGNLINMTATIKAYKQDLLGNREKKEKKQKKKTFGWSKTDHTFLPKDVLIRYQRTFGDVLIENGITDPKTLKKQLSLKPADMQIGKFLVNSNTITINQFLQALSFVKGIQFVNLSDFSMYDLRRFSQVFQKEVLQELMVLPIVCQKDNYVMAYCDETPDNAQTTLRGAMKINIISAFTTSEMVSQGIKIIYGDMPSNYHKSFAMRSLNEEKINVEQYIIASNYAISMHKTQEEVLQIMGLL